MRRKGRRTENTGISREIEGEKIVSVSVVIKRFMGVEGEGVLTLPTATFPFVFFELRMCRQAKGVWLNPTDRRYEVPLGL